jgi:hypothetical protein
VENAERWNKHQGGTQTLSRKERGGPRRSVASRCRANTAHIRQSRPDSGRGVQVKAFKLFKLFHICSEAFSMGAHLRSSEVGRGVKSGFLVEGSGVGGWGLGVRI